MNCPNCGQPMEPGQAILDKTWLNWFLFQYGSTNLVFRGDDSRQTTLMTPWSTSSAFFCRRCGAATIATNGAEWTDSWEAMRCWCTSCIETYFGFGRHAASNLIDQLDPNSFRSAGQAAQDVILSITDHLNEGEGLVMTSQEEQTLFTEWSAILRQNLSPEDTLKAFRDAERRCDIE